MWSVAESTVDENRTLPVSPPPPWPAPVRATVWWHRATDDARSIGPKNSLPITVGAVIDYLDSPVGPYREILASPTTVKPGRGLGPLPRVAIPFIAVDSDASVHGGRTHWNLPKVLAEFTGDVLGEAGAQGEGWSVSTASIPVGPTFPVIGSTGFAQPTTGGLLLASGRMRGRARFAKVTVTSDGPTLGTWLPPGTYRGIQVVSGKIVTGPARNLPQPR
ncbi:hypothetical protein GCM10007304_36020 [Rhodococcoides trifolii]|uniref:Acetoacetate decarboxylase n=1 Tax=Rhodococcoides trifolii TaxID=908250 RepID=A0A917G1Z0_9NOCA|nr:hypothetical protein [Rhodococcus trifolii]GGG18838.1 hypothetical protein GCM10007304_36020 [Rhodococcus trifolii]